MTETLNDAATDPQQTIAELQRKLAERTAERDELLQQRTATADVLKVISRSAFDLESALVNVCETAARLCDADQAAIYRREGDLYHFAASFGFPQEYADAWRAAGPAPNDPKSPLVGHRAVAERRPVQVLDVTADAAFLGSTSRASQSRTALGIPLMREGKPVGNFVLARQRVEAFTDRQLELVQTFADQAVIAIENARLFNETREALDRQTATAEILNVIASSPTDTQPVFDVIARSATELCEGMNSGVYLLQNGLIHVAGHHNVSPEQFALARTAFPTPPHRGIMSGRAILNRAVAHVPDIAADPEYTAESIVKAGFRSVVAVPMLRNGEPIGAINVTRQEARPFSDRQIELLRTFADQAVIAIENSRLFNETQEALERQTASADILKVIASSPSDAQPVFNALVLTARRLLGREMTGILLCGEDATFRAVAGAGPDGLIPIDPVFAAPTKIDPEANFPSRAIVSKKNLHLPDWSAIDLPEEERKVREIIGWSSTLYLPMLRGEECIGVLLVGGTQPGIFSEADIALAESFRDQAVIAIENARLFNETREALERQTATAEVLQVISNSISDATPVFDRILESTERLITFENAAIILAMLDELVHLGAFRGPEAAALQGRYPRPLAESLLPIMMAERRQMCFEDAANGPDVPALTRQVALATTKGNFSIAMTPLMWEGNVIGMLNVSRDAGVKFNEKELSLLRTFADQAVIAIQNARLFEEVQAKTRDLTESLQQQTATADVLKVISRSAFDLDAVMHTLARSAGELCAADICGLYIREGDFLVCRGYTAISKEQEEFVRQARIPADATNFYMNRALSSGEIANIGDFENDRSVGTRAFQEKLGFRSLLIVPLMREGHGIGLFVLGRDRIGEFSLRHIELVQTFADQAVIAIENVRLFNETQEALEQQTATAEVLQVISNSISNATPVFERILESTERLITCDNANIFLAMPDEQLHLAAFRGPDADTVRGMYPRPLAQTVAPAVIAARRQIVYEDVANHPDVSEGLRESARAIARGTFSVAMTPLIWEGNAIGMLSVSRDPAIKFNEKELSLLRTFADQAVIAIQNARLFEEVQAKTHDLEEALRYQTGSANILNVIASSPTDVQPVLKAIVESACEFCEAYDAIVILKDEGELQIYAHHGPIPHDRTRWPNDRTSTSGRAMADQRPIHVHDVLSDEGVEFLMGRHLSLLDGCRTLLSAPLLREGEAIGALALRRAEVHPFSDKQIGLLQTFADQAVIAIENTRLFNETNEALEQQKASADILSVISSSVADTRPVFDKILSSIEHLFAADERFVLLAGEDDLLRIGAVHGPNSERARALFPVPLQGSASEVAIRDRRLVTHANVFNDRDVPPVLRETARRFGKNYSMAVAPLLWEDRAIGSILVGRTSMKAFDEKECALLRTFADQAVIAIQNAQLFNETKEALERQTATADILKVIASSPDDVQPVFQAIAERSNHLVGGFATTVVSIVDDFVHLSAFTPTTPAADAALRAFYPRPLSGFSYSDAVRRGEIHRIVDSEVELASQSDQLTMVRQRGWRSALWVPLLLDGEAIGVIGVTRDEPGPFADHHVEMLKTFADQAVIAISNVKLFRQVQERTRELSQSLDDLRTAQDRLVQTEKLASLGQLTAGIAHEIKNPLNFVNNFSALSVELIDEMTEVFENPALDEASRRKELDEIRELLKSNLEKVVQHGKRADSIVKNMLLHSREGSGEQRPADINALLDESLNLAYHGARAEKPDFNITLQRDFDPDAGAIDVFPQEITRAFINLISNGFYAASKHKAENGKADFEPVLSAATKNLGSQVEIRIRDNGTGIPSEVREKIFNPFFTTKPSGEGTGLGLSMSHDIIVKQHGGRIEVETEPGRFTEFTIILPRASQL